ncbi:MAG: hypothetical protein IPL73_27925 [Candidatus Obscuribacter sp.]|nr:hypothetical protein [Candidatus Obscuribacter sp.]
MVAPQKRHSLSRLDALDRDDGENLYVIRGLYKLALGWQDRGHLNAAKTIYQFIVKVPERTPSVNCEEVTKSMGNLASIFLIQDALMEAEDTFLKALLAAMRPSATNMSFLLYSCASMPVCSGAWA